VVNGSGDQVLGSNQLINPVLFLHKRSRMWSWEIESAYSIPFLAVFETSGVIFLIHFVHYRSPAWPVIITSHGSIHHPEIGGRVEIFSIISRAKLGLLNVALENNSYTKLGLLSISFSD
jgi:hypothetical protein